MKKKYKSECHCLTMKGEKIKLPGPFDPNAHEDPRFAGRKTLNGEQVDEYTSLFATLSMSSPLYNDVVYFEVEGVKIPAKMVFNYWNKFHQENLKASPSMFSEQFWKALACVRDNHSKIEQYWKVN